MRFRKKAALLLSAALCLSAAGPLICPAPLSGIPSEVMASERDDAWALLTYSEWEAIRQTNRYRRSAGLEMLSMTEDTRRAAGIRVQELKQVFGHTRPDGTDFGTVMGENGRYIVGENAAAGYYTAGEVMTAWKNSDGHRVNLQDSRYSHICVRTKDSYWEQLFTICSGSTHQDVRLLADSRTPVVVEGTGVESLNYLICFTCSACGKTAYMPVIKEMCRGYDPYMVGDQTVTVTYKDWSAAFPVTVRAKRLLTNISLSADTLTLKTGESSTVKASVYPSDADNPNVVWVSTNPNVAVKTGNGITGFQPGTTEIYCVASDQGKVESNRCVVTVRQMAKEIIISRLAVDMKAGEEYAMIWKVRPDDTSDTSVMWYSTAPSVVSVDQNGVLKAVSEGTATVYCTAQDGSGVKSQECSVTVRKNGTGASAGSSTAEKKTEKPVRSLSIKAIDIECHTGYQTTLSLTVTPRDAANPSVTWYSTDEQVASVDQRGNVRALSAGSAEIYCIAQDGSNVWSNRCRVRVKESNDSSGRNSGSSSGGNSNSSSGGNSSSSSGGNSGGSSGGSSGSVVQKALPSYVVRGSWKKKSDGSWNFTDYAGQVYRNTWAAVENPYASASRGQQPFDWFRFDRDGRMVTGWFYDRDDGYWYYLNPVSDNTKGRMITGWRVVDGVYYYFNPVSDGHRGRMYADEMTPDGYYVDQNGKWVP